MIDFLAVPGAVDNNLSRRRRLIERRLGREGEDGPDIEPCVDRNIVPVVAVYNAKTCLDRVSQRKKEKERERATCEKITRMSEVKFTSHKSNSNSNRTGSSIQRNGKSTDKKEQPVHIPGNRTSCSL